ncbi:hypothetical protein AVEN_2138-1 [Araneus ventricosus]|uniref:Uncharacterized protein n=1 Tax=Araneus ventricosus TaxID=182803 RepID=A0A4Y2L7K3_ARAVE|nr:hypothetical protein AVEN_2138-1 [Araneus ventricosus]
MDKTVLASYRNDRFFRFYVPSIRRLDVTLSGVNIGQVIGFPKAEHHGNAVHFACTEERNRCQHEHETASVTPRYQVTRFRTRQRMFTEQGTG